MVNRYRDSRLSIGSVSSPPFEEFVDNGHKHQIIVLVITRSRSLILCHFRKKMERRKIVKKRTGKMVASSPLVRCMREHIFLNVI